MSPIFLKNKIGLFKDLGKIESYLKKYPAVSVFDSKVPYFTVITSGRKKFDSSAAKSISKKGWNLVEAENSLNLWRKPMPLLLPKGIHIKIDKYFDPQIYPHFRKSMVRNFKTDRIFMKYFDDMIKTVEENVISVLLCNSKGATVGYGLVAVANGGAFLFCGSIDSKYRGKGLWHVLVGARQMASLSRGAKAWVTTTKKPEIIWKGEESFRISFFQKSVKD